MIRPRPYLSWSQLTLFESSPDAYARAYIEGKPIFENAGIRLGSKISEALETTEETGDILNDYIVAMLPKLEIMEAELNATITIEGEAIPLYGRADTASGDLSRFKEYKTGISPWTQKKVDEHGQITMYCLLIREMTGATPKDIELIYASTRRRADGEMEPTGDIRIFKTERTTADILKMKVRIKKAWEGIGLLCEKYII